ncbi:MAG: flagellar filament capping protein FliD [Clostridia bacterium]|nr:flagellar filament capping protein FliD [Clostridia bacterium]
MAISNVSNMLNNKMRMTGLSSGLDIDGMIEKLMAVERSKVDKIKQNKTVLEWKRDDYRSIISTLNDLSSSYFDVLKPTSNLRSSTAFSAFSTTYNGSATSSVFTATANASATPGSYTITDIALAKAARVEGTAGLASDVVSAPITDLNINSGSDNNKITVTLNGTSKEIMIANNPGSVTALKDDLQSKINAAFGDAKITVAVTGAGNDQIKFTTARTTDSMSIGLAYNSGKPDIFGPNLTSGITLNSQNNKFKVSLGSTTKDITLAAGSYANADALLSEIQGKLEAVPEFAGKIRVLNQSGVLSLKAIGTAGSATGSLASQDVSSGATVNAANKSMDITLDGVTKTITLDEKTYTKDELLTAIQSKMNTAFGSNKGMVSVNGANQLRFESISSSTSVSTSLKENGGLTALGFETANRSNKINTQASFNDIRTFFDSAAAPFSAGAPDADGYDIEFTINNKSFKFKSASDTINSMIAKVNADTTANVTMKYDQLTDKITVESKQAGAAQRVQITEQNGNLMAVLGLKDQNVTGSDAKVSINGQVVERPTNSFTVNGINFDIKDTNAGPITLNIASDTSKVVDLVKGFVTKYNEVLDKINGKLEEKRYKEYVPLSDAQKEAMKEGDIKLWEEKGKSGLLRADPILSGIVNNMRKALYDSVGGVSVNLSSIGIKTGSYSDKGKLIIDEAKLKTAITENPEQVINLFTKDDSGYSYNDTLNDSSKRTARYNASGIAQRLYDVIQDNIRITRDTGGYKGKLLEKAGKVGDTSEFANTLYKEIEDQEELIDKINIKLYDKETRYYKKFTSLERILSQMNAQGSWLSSQTGG